MGRKSGNRDFLVFSVSVIAAVLAARLWNIVLGDLSLVVNGTEVHHIYFGITLLGLVGLGHQYSRLSRAGKIHLAVAGFGTGLITDELAFMLFTPDTFSYYFTPISTSGAAFMTAFALSISYLVTSQSISIHRRVLQKIN